MKDIPFLNTINYFHIIVYWEDKNCIILNKCTQIIMNNQTDWNERDSLFK